MVAHEHVRAIPAPTTRAVYLLALALAPVACVLLYVFDPAANDDPYPNCPFFWMTGYYCPGCGTLRAYHQILRGDPASGFGLNPLTVIALPAIVYAAASMWLMGYRGRRLPQPRMTARTGWGIGVVLLAFGAIRNLPIETLEWMRP